MQSMRQWKTKSCTVEWSNWIICSCFVILIAYAIVTWGVAKSSDDKQTGCQSYTFEALQSGMVKRAINALRNNTPIPEKAECVLRAERLVKYYHFGHPETTGRLTPFLLNK